ncbi:hypothetical protein [Vibrio sp. C8]
MQDFDIEITLKQSATAYYGNDHTLGGYLLKGCLRRLSLLPLNLQQATYLNETIAKLNEIVKKCDFTGLADMIMFELIQNFPDFDSLLAQEAQDSAQN